MASASHPDLPALYCAHVDNLVATLSEEMVVGVPRRNCAISSRRSSSTGLRMPPRMEIEGKLLERLQTENPAGRAGRLLVCVVRLSWLRGRTTAVSCLCHFA
jgi:hypothetical protein